MKASLRIFSLVILVLLFVVTINGSSKYDPTDPSTWSSHELKEWLAENRLTYEGIPEKHELFELVKSNWYELKDRSKSSTEAVESFISKYADIVKESSYEAGELTEEKYNAFAQEVADQIESVRQTTGLTEEQVQSAFSGITKKLKGTKDAGNKNLQRALDEVKRSYSMAQANRDVIIQETTNRVQDDLLKSDQVSQETVDWFKDQINKMNEQASFSKARTETQVSLILQGIQEQLTKRKIVAANQISSTNEKLYNSVKPSIESTLERLGLDLNKKFGGASDYVVDELRSQFSSVNDYRLLTQEKIQSAVDAIGQKLSNGKNMTVEQLQQIKQSVYNYFGFVKQYYDSATGQARQTAFETKETQQERLNNLIESIRSYFSDASNKSSEQVSKMIKNAQENISATQQLTAEQSKILSDTIQEQFGNVKDSRDLTEEKMNSFVETLKSRFASVRDYAADTYDSASKKVEEGYDVAQNKVSTGAENVADRFGETYKNVKDQFAPPHHKDEL